MSNPKALSSKSEKEEKITSARVRRVSSPKRNSSIKENKSFKAISHQRTTSKTISKTKITPTKLSPKATPFDSTTLEKTSNKNISKILPEVLLLKILQYLNFKDISQLNVANIIFRTITNPHPLDLTPLHKPLTMEKFLQHFKDLSSINLIGLNFYPPSSIRGLTPLEPFLLKLRKLTLSSQNESPSDISFLSKCINLFKIKLNLPVLSLRPLLNCKNLSHLKFSFNFKTLQKDYTLISESKSIQYLTLDTIYEIGEITSLTLELPLLLKLKIVNSSHLKELPSCKGFPLLQEIRIHCCRNLIDITGIEGCSNLEKLHIIGCDTIDSLELIATCPNLKDIQIIYYSKRSFNSINTIIFSNLKKLSKLSLGNCNLEEKSSFEYFLSLKELSLNSITGKLQIPVLLFSEFNPGLEKLSLSDMLLTDLSELKGSSDVTELTISDCKFLTNINFVLECTKLIKLDIRGCPLLNLDFLSEHSLLTRNVLLTELYLANFTISNLEFLQFHPSLTRLTLQFSNITNLDGIASRPSLVEVNLLYSETLTDLSELDQLSNLKILNISNLLNLENLEPVGRCANLKELSIYYTKAADVSPLGNLKKLKMLNLDCTHIQRLMPILECTALKELHLEWTDQILDLKEFSEYFPGIIQTTEL